MTPAPQQEVSDVRRWQPRFNSRASIPDFYHHGAWPAWPGLSIFPGNIEALEGKKNTPNLYTIHFFCPYPRPTPSYPQAP
jgi:hypothetical protein